MGPARAYEAGRERTPKKPTARELDCRSPGSAAHPILELQRQVGNRAVTAALGRARAIDARGALVSEAGNRAMSKALGVAVQRQGGESSGQGSALAPPGPDRPASLQAPGGEAAAGERIQHEIDRQVAALPGLDERAVPEPQQVEQGRVEASQVSADLGELGLADNAPLGRFLEAQMGGGGRAAPPVVEELRQGPGPVDASPARPSLGSRIWAGLGSAASWVGKKASGAADWIGEKASGAKRSMAGAWSSLKSAFRRENRHDVGAKAPIVGSVGSLAGSHASTVLGAVTPVVDNPATEGAANLVSHGSGEQLQHVGSQIGQAGHDAGNAATNGTSATLEHPSEFLHSFGSGGLELLHQVASVVGVFFSGLKAAIDLKSLVSSVRVLKALKAARAEALALPAPERLVQAIDYAIRQKYEKIVKRAFGAAAALAALGVGLAILIANPVGAALAAMIIGGVGATVFLYKIGRWAWKKWGSKNLSEKRKEIATLLYNQVRTGDVTARDAVRALHLDVDEVLAPAREQGIGMIMRKLKSA